MKTTNFVLYAIAGDGSHRPLGSVDESAKSQAVFRFAHFANAEFSRCDKAGSPHPELRAVQETRTGGDDVDKTARLVEISAQTLKPLVEGDKGAESIEALFKKGT